MTNLLPARGAGAPLTSTRAPGTRSGTRSASRTVGFQWALRMCGLTGLAAIPATFILIRRTRKADVTAAARSQDL